MKNIATVSLITALGGFVLTPQTARADDKALAAIGGFIGGVIVGSTINHSHPGPEYCEPGYGGGDQIVIRHGPRHRGYWKQIAVRTWVPGRWVMHYDNCGRRFRHFERGYYTFHTEYVWVSGRGYRDDRQYDDPRY